MVDRAFWLKRAPLFFDVLLRIEAVADPLH
jgi:hypothetical protein